MIGKLPEHLSSPNSTRALTPQGSGSASPGGAVPQQLFSTTSGQDVKNALLDAKPAALSDVAMKLPIMEKRAAVEASEERGESDFPPIKATPRGGAEDNSQPKATSQAAPAEQATPRRSSTTGSKKAEVHVQSKPTPRRSSASSTHKDEDAAATAAAAAKPATKATPRRSIPGAPATKEAASTGARPTASPHRTPRASAAEEAAGQAPAKPTGTPRRTPRSSSQAEEVAAKPVAAAGKPTPTPRRRSGTAMTTSAVADAPAPAAAAAAPQQKSIPRPTAVAAAPGVKKAAAAAPAVPKQQQLEEAALQEPTEAPAVVAAEQQQPAAAAPEPQQEAVAAPEPAVTVEAPVVPQQEVAAQAVPESDPQPAAAPQPQQQQVQPQVLPAAAAQEVVAAAAGKPGMVAELVPKPDGSVELRISASSALYQQAVAATAATSASQPAPAAGSDPAAVVAVAVEDAPADVEVPLGGGEEPGAAVDASAATPRAKGNRLLRFFSSSKTARQQGTPPTDGQLVPVAQQGWRSMSFRAQLARSLKALGRPFSFRRSMKRKDSSPATLFRRLSNSMRRKRSGSGQVVVLMEDGGPMWSGMPLEPVAETSREGSASSAAVVEMPRTPHAAPHTACCKASCPGCGAGLIVEVRADSTSPVLRLDGPFKPPRRVPMATAGVRMSCWAVLS